MSLKVDQIIMQMAGDELSVKAHAHKSRMITIKDVVVK